MRRHSRRAFTLIQLMALLPLIAITTTVAGQLVIQTMRIQRDTLEQINDESRMRHMLSRLHRDARYAVDAVMEDEQHLRLTMSRSKSVEYEVQNKRLIRTEEGASTPYEWLCDGMVPQLRIEQVGSSGRIVWLTFKPYSSRRSIVRKTYPLSAAVTIGTGGPR